jgi:deoxyribonuclease V
MGKLKGEPDLVVCDGQGLAHPRRFGLACHIGVLYEKPTLGIAKSLLGGNVREPARRRGSRQPIRWDGEVVGHAVRTRDDVKPVYVSPGHKLDHQEAVRLCLWLDSRYRVPAPTRMADQRVRVFKRAIIGEQDSS